jgi:hypothetical protein
LAYLGLVIITDSLIYTWCSRFTPGQPVDDNRELPAVPGVGYAQYRRIEDLDGQLSDPDLEPENFKEPPDQASFFNHWRPTNICLPPDPARFASGDTRRRLIQMDQSAGKKRKALGDENIIRIMIAGKSAAAAEDLPRAKSQRAQTPYQTRRFVMISSSRHRTLGGPIR